MTGVDVNRPGQCVVASSNQGKLREFRMMLEPLGYESLAQSDLNIEPAPEPHATFVENALEKARHAARISGLPALADDSGICVPALGGAPGVYSARFAARAGGEHSDRANNAHLIAQLGQIARRAADKPVTDRAAVAPAIDPYEAYYYCVLVWLNSADDPQPLIADARWPGRIVEDARGAGGFGYDPHFLLPDLGLTAAELTPEKKNAVSHRGQAMRRLQELLSGPAGSVGHGG